LTSFERILPLREPSHLAELSMATLLRSWTEGTIGELSSLLRKAAIAAIETGEERITENILKRVDWMPPSARRNVNEVAM
jgi:hypothetical protein